MYERGNHRSIMAGLRASVLTRNLRFPALLLLALLAFEAIVPQTTFAGDVTVCDQGCDFTSIQDAVDSASPSDVITISGTFIENLVINKDLTIQGSGKEQTIIDGGGSSTVFKIEPSTVVNISKVTIQNGAAVNGAGIHNQGELTLNESVVANNTAFKFGGGIFNEGDLTLNEVSVSFNSASENGGGIYTSASATLINVVVEENKSGGGAGIFNTGGDLTLKASRVDRNKVSFNANDNNGGGINSMNGAVVIEESTIANNGRALRGGGIRIKKGSLTLKKSTVSGNESSVGGGIENSMAIVTIIDSTIKGNSVSGSARGGGIFNDSRGTKLEIIRSTVSDNMAGSNGGGIYTISGDVLVLNSTLSNNTAIQNGGGLFSHEQHSSGTITLINSSIIGNTADVGGGIHSFSGNVTIKNTLIANNSATSGGNDCIGEVQSLGHNLISDVAVCVVSGDTTGNLTNIEPLVGPLQDNGGLTETHALLSQSPAIDHIPSENCTDIDGNPLTSDQRGEVRPESTHCDIGAFEMSSDGPPEPTPVPAPTPEPTPTFAPTPEPTPTFAPTPEPTPTFAPTPEPASARTPKEIAITYTIDINNDEPETLKAAGVVDTFPYYGFFSISIAQGNCGDPGQRATCRLGKVLIGDLVIFSFKVTVTITSR